MMISVIVFDSNQLPSPHSPMLTMLKAAASRIGHTLATTDIVVKEVVYRRQEDLGKRIEAFQKAQENLNKLLPPKSRLKVRLGGIAGNLPGTPSGRQIESFEADLRRSFQVLETHPGDALEGLRREATRTTPCKKGLGGRDAAIYLTAVRAAEHAEMSKSGCALPLIFVSNDNGFAESSDSNLLHPNLQEELNGRQVILCRDIVAALTEIGYPHAEVDGVEITSKTDFLDLLRDAIVSAAAGNIPPELLSRIDRAEVQLPHPSGGKARVRQCLGDGLAISTVEGRWAMRVITGPISEAARERSPMAYRGFPLAADVTALVVQDADGNLIDIDFTSLVFDDSMFRSRAFPVSW